MSSQTAAATGRLLLVAAAGLLVLGAGPGPSATTRPVWAQALAQSSDGDIAAGRAVFQAHCAMCHGADATGMMGMHPSLRGSVERLSREGVEVAIRKGRATQPPMPAWEGRLTDAEIAAVVAYVASLPPGPRNFGPDGGGMMGRGMMGGRRWILWAAVLVMILGVAAFVILVVRRRRATSEEPRLVLDRRYAAGELSRDEYLERRRDLES